MLRISNVVVCLLLYLTCFLHNEIIDSINGFFQSASRNIISTYFYNYHKHLKIRTHRIEAKETYSADNETLLRDLIDWKCTATSASSVKRNNCINGTCQCDSDYIFDGSFTVCITVISAYGDDCHESMQCSAYLSRGGICRNGICVCAEGYYYIHGKCRAYSGLLEKCQEDGDCYVNGDFQATRCINNICNCSLGYYQRKYRTCRPDAKVHGKRCIINNDCKGWINSTCDNYICDTSQTHIGHIAKLLYNDNIEKKIQSRKNTTLKRNVQRMRTVNL